MTGTLAIRLLLVSVPAVAWTQAIPVRPAFELASVTPHLKSSVAGSMAEYPEKIAYTNVTVRRVLMRAYSVTRDQIVGPPWLDTDAYDIFAALPKGATKDQMAALLQNLLTDRFRITVRRAGHEISVYALLAGRNGLKLKRLESFDPRRASVSLSTYGSYTDLETSTVAYLADQLSLLMDHPVLDMTGIQGNFEIRTNIYTASSDKQMASIFSAVQGLGLKLEPRRVHTGEMIIGGVPGTYN